MMKDIDILLQGMLVPIEKVTKMANFDGYIIDTTTLFNIVKAGITHSSPIGTFHVGVGVVYDPSSLFNSIKSGYVIPKPEPPLIPNHLQGYVVNTSALFSSIKLGYTGINRIPGSNTEGQKLDKRFKFIGL